MVVLAALPVVDAVRCGTLRACKPARRVSSRQVATRQSWLRWKLGGWLGCLLRVAQGKREFHVDLHRGKRESRIRNRLSQCPGDTGMSGASVLE